MRKLLLGIAVMISLEMGQAEDALVFVSSFAGGDDGAIQAYHLDTETGTLEATQKQSEADHPFYLAVTPDQKYLYSIHTDAFGGKEDEEIAAWRIEDGTGKLTLLNRQSAKGSAACYLDVDATGRSLFVANYSSGSVAALPIGKDGALGEASSFFKHADETKPDAKPKGHSILTSPDNRFVLAADIGIDQILSYRLENAEKGKMVANDPPFARTPEKSGPRHIMFHPNGKHFYAINEYGNSVTHFLYEPESGKLTLKDTVSSVPDDFEGKSFCADLQMTPDGKFLYGTNRGHDSIACYRIGDDGALDRFAIEPAGGKGPQNLAITNNGKFLLCANLPANQLQVFSIDPDSGSIKSVGGPIEIVKPSCILILE